MKTYIAGVLIALASGHAMAYESVQTGPHTLLYHGSTSSQSVTSHPVDVADVGPQCDEPVGALTHVCILAEFPDKSGSAATLVPGASCLFPETDEQTLFILAIGDVVITENPPYKSASGSGTITTVCYNDYTGRWRSLPGLDTFTWAGTLNYCSISVDEGITVGVDGDVHHMSGAVAISCSGSGGADARITIPQPQVTLRSGEKTETVTVSLGDDGNSSLDQTGITQSVVTVKASMDNDDPAPGQYTGAVTISVEVI